MKVIDLSHTIGPDMLIYPGTEQPVLLKACTLEDHGFREMKMTLYTHTGTHMDSPAHLLEAGLSLDQLSLDSFYGEGIVIDCSKLAMGQKISLNILERYLTQLTQVNFVIFYTGWSQKWNSIDYFNDYPVPDEQTIGKLIELKIKGIGIDTISVDPVGSAKLPNHRRILSHNMLIIENLTNLEHLRDHNFKFSCFPLKIEHADGSPIRATAILD